MRHIIVFSHLDSVLKKGYAVFPITDLTAGEQRTTQRNERACGPKSHSLITPFREQLTHAPSEHNQDPDQRHVRVTVRHGLNAHLNQSDCRNQCAKKPKPSSE